MTSKADGLNNAEIRAAVQRGEGGKSRPIRKRGYHRALKRGEMWAVMQKSIVDMTNRMARDFYAPSIFKQLSENIGLMGFLDREKK